VPFSKLSLSDKLFTRPCKNPAAKRSPAPVKSIIFKFFWISHLTTSFLLIAILPFSPRVKTISFPKFIEKVNILFLKQKFQDQSQISIGKYRLDLNSRKLLNKEKSLKLTERETEIIIFLNNSIKSQSIENLQNKVWGHVPDLETHTVETHIYRLRKKLMETFDGDKFIISTKEGYKI